MAKTTEIDQLFDTEAAVPAPKARGRLAGLSAPAAPKAAAAPAKAAPAPAAPKVAPKAAAAAPARPAKVPAAAAPANPAPAGESKGGRVAGEARGVTGVNIFGLLRQTYSAKNGATLDEGMAAVRAATDGVMAANGEPYSEAAMKSRVNKFLIGALQSNQLEKVKEKDGIVWYRYTGEVTLTRGGRRAAAEEAAPAPAPAPAPVAPKKVAAKK